MYGAIPLLLYVPSWHAQGQLFPFLVDTFRGEIDRTVIGHGRENKYGQNFGWKT